MPMTEFMKFVKCENEGVFDIKQMYNAEKAFKKVQNHRNLHFAYMGMRVNVAGKWGTIVGNWKTNLFVLFDGEIEAYNCHPYWEIAYFDEEGNVVHSYQKGEYAI
ncbi:Uncharacterized protein BWINRA5_02822 [Bacillus mycoides]|jgi:hypothetical protein|nr:hypothetical protein [Bacillus mycoides]MBK5474215.1 hypothetical protein [Bacillus sp. TH19]MED1383534.1 hypothetical protein [Bacillus mycoides]QWH78354.1 hypothetical protein EXW59_17220 [Bacillus mycoides]QWI43402.1 hypothetical protein EXW55_10475 [Bacillus mycoides]SCA99416.1 Uncharacterized protein BWINRA5_02822 [Bacillus mycoides]